MSARTMELPAPVEVTLLLIGGSGAVGERDERDTPKSAESRVPDEQQVVGVRREQSPSVRPHSAADVHARR